MKLDGEIMVESTRFLDVEESEREFARFVSKGHYKSCYVKSLEDAISCSSNS